MVASACSGTDAPPAPDAARVDGGVADAAAADGGPITDSSVAPDAGSSGGIAPVGTVAGEMPWGEGA